MTLDILLLLAAVIGGLVMIPLGLPGIWLMVLAGLVHSVAVTPPTIGTVTLVTVFVIAALAEWLEFSVSRKYTLKYGGSSRAAWGAILGGIAGAMVGIPIPVIGSVIGAFVGSFAGALVGEYSVARDGQRATQAAKGAIIGRAVATALKSVAGCVIGFWLLAAASR
ncbi:MAG TPA: DUF456 domain-containing protein [Gemmatimonadaceae bacterium]|nr:DUF456 domain-containing protein [Gemmatimonadaceae bacterium]